MLFSSLRSVHSIQRILKFKSFKKLLIVGDINKL